MKIEVMNVKESKQGYIEGLRRGKGKETSNYNLKIFLRFKKNQANSLPVTELRHTVQSMTTSEQCIIILI